MVAEEFIKKVVRKKWRATVSLIATGEDGNWWHIHRDEEIPQGFALSLNIRDRVSIEKS